ncbi:hypothetical protein B0J11DRAFT_73781 [Dendryphion nanum]|uniref:Zn(2)-C6 fungal-type domain-containing protein n=1 Tax=Dendryphion nanum TaxID=256645 RepID=A0A9P9DG96_9PLEO|nr:hypothetical protein B0J11DRAFT_73781 [Dendryphion nanum]
MAGGSRRTHSKSRNGCSQCKKRSKKCDEKPPICGNCRKRGAVCDYTAISAAVERIANRIFGRDIFAASRLASPLPLPTLEAIDVALLHFYATRTALSLSGQRTKQIWQSEAPGTAKSYDFLLHGLLALSALHGCYMHLGHSEHYAQLASKHHATAIKLFRSNIVDVNAENGNAIAIFSLFNMIFSLGVPPSSGFAGVDDPISEFINVFGVVRSAWAALEPQLHNLGNGSLQPLVKASGISRDQQSLGEKSLKLICEINSYIDDSDDTAEEKATYRDALQILLGFFWSLPDAAPLSIILGWPTCFSDHFFKLLTKKRTIPLLMLSYWFVPVTRIPMLWLDAWVERIVIAIWNRVDDRARHLLTWPAQSVGLLPQDMHASGCQCFECYLDERVPEFAWKGSTAPLRSV